MYRHDTTQNFESTEVVCLSRQIWHANHQSGEGIVSFSAHYIDNWTYKTSVIACEPLSNLSNVNDLQTSALSKLSISADVLVTVSELMTSYSLPAFLTPVSCRLEVGADNEELCFASRLDRVVIRALNQSGETVLNAINQAGHMLTGQTTTGGAVGFEAEVVRKLPWFEQLNYIEEALKTLAGKALETVGLVSRALKPFQEVALRIRQSDKVTCSLAFPSVKLLKAALFDLEQEASDAGAILPALSREFDSLAISIDNNKENIYTIATIIDPRFKLQWCDETHQPYFKKCFIQVAKKVAKCEPLIAVKSEDSKAGLGSGSGFFTRILKQQPESVEASSVTSEVLRYLEEPLVLETCDVLEYWQSNETSFPHLSKLARSYLSIPISSSGVKDLCALSGETVDINTATLTMSGEKLAQYVLLRSGMHQTSDDTNPARPELNLMSI